MEISSISWNGAKRQPELLAFWLKAGKEEKIKLLKKNSLLDDSLPWTEIIMHETDFDVVLLTLRLLKSLLRRGTLIEPLVANVLVEKLTDFGSIFSLSEVKAAAFDCILNFVKVRIGDEKALSSEKLKMLLLKSMCSSNYLERCSSMRLFSLTCLSDGAVEDDDRDRTMLLLKFLNDADYRIRKMTLDLLVGLRLTLDDGLYQEILNSLKDDYDVVRKATVTLILKVSENIPVNKMIFLDNGEDIRMIDDAFAKVCDLMNDPSLEVRSTVAHVLGSFKNVSDSFLVQTFSKEVISHLKRKRRILEVNAPTSDSATESMEEFLSEGFRLLDLGAAGAFVHAFEDEFSVVRYNAISSVKSLSEYSESFASTAVEFLIDMMNDEIDEVRCNALDALNFIAKKYSTIFPFEHLKVITGVLDDGNPAVRNDSRNLLRVCRIMDFESVTLCYKAFQNNLKRYPEDKLSILECGGHLGYNNGKYFRGDNLRDFGIILERYCLSPEPYVLEDFHALSVITIANSCFQNRKLLPLLPKYFSSHAQHLSLVYKSCFLTKIFPPFGMNDCLISKENCLPLNSTNVIVELAKEIGSLDSAPSIYMVVKRMKQRYYRDNEDSRFIEVVLKGLELEFEIRTRQKELCRENILSKLEALLSITVYIEHCFGNCSFDILSLLKYWRVFIACQYQELNPGDEKLDLWVQGIYDELGLEGATLSCKNISRLLLKVFPHEPSLIKGTLLKPDDKLKTRVFASSYPNAMRISGYLEGPIENHNSVVIKLLYPDLTADVIQIRADRVQNLGNNRWFFDQEVYIVSNKKWVENYLGVSIVINVKATFLESWERSLFNGKNVYLGDKVGEFSLYNADSDGLLIPISGTKRISCICN